MSATGQEYTAALLRHFTGLRDSTHGSARSRHDKEQLFGQAVALLDAYARETLNEINQDLLLGTGEVSATGVTRSATGGAGAKWTLSWPQQRAAKIQPIILRAYFGSQFLHPHLQSGTAGDWPLNVFNQAQAAAGRPALRAMASADLHNLVFQLGGNVQIIPAVQALPQP